MKNNYINKLVKRILFEADNNTPNVPDGLKKLQDAVKSGCLKNGKIRADKDKEMSTGEYPSGTNFYYYYTSTSGNIYLIRPNLSIYDYTNKKDLGKKINCPQSSSSSTGATTGSTTGTTTGSTTGATTGATTGSTTGTTKTEETGQQIFEKYRSNYQKRIKPFINVDRSRIVFKGDIGQDIDSNVLQKLNKFIESTYMMSLEKAKPKSGNEIKYVWTSEEYKNRY